jgi:hypothetical protein
MTRRFSRLAIVLLTVLAVAGLLLQHGSLPHRHDVYKAGVYNQEHDLGLLAALASHADPPSPAPAIVVDETSAPIAPWLPLRLPVRHARAGQTRAPPSA